MDIDQIKRLAVLALGVVTVAGNKKLGLNLDTSDVAALSAMVLGFITQSALNTAHARGIEAAAKIVTPADAAKVLGS